jgi:cyclopropane-fatty-acyl-phospholipid synthase
VEKVENIGGHYTKTLRLWRENFLANFDTRIQAALKKEHPDMTAEEIDVFKRKWEVRFNLPARHCTCGSIADIVQYYFTYCEAGFITKTLGDVIITVGREGALELMEGIPL